MRLSTADSPPFSTDDDTGFYDRVLKEVFSDLGIDLEIIHLPSARSLQEANSGRVDGEFGQTRAAGEAYSNLVMVPEPLAEWHFSAFVLEGTEGPRSFEELRDYHVGFINGWKLYEEKVTESRSITKVEGEKQLFAILLAGRVDVVLYNRLRGLAWVQRNGESRVRMVTPPLSVDEMHLFLHRRHAGLVSAIDQELARLKSSGRYAEMQMQAFGFLP
jgi:polar amino acid transport system substrate-binding protein